MNWKKIWGAIVKWLKETYVVAPPPPPPPPPPPGDIYHYQPGKWVEQEVDITKGSVEFDVWIPENGRSDDWGKAEVFSIRDSTTKKVGNLFSLHPYKIKACHNASCAEPRYNLKWDAWRHIRIEWTSTTFRVIIDGGSLQVQISTPWGPNVKSYYGHPPTTSFLAGAQIKGIKWG